MHCPFCGALDTKVIDSRLVTGGNQVRRRRACQECSERYTTYETPELIIPKVIKNNGSRVPFDEEKLRLGITKAIEKRPVDSEHIEQSINNIICQLRATGEREIPSRTVGEAVMFELKKLDQVAYIRFASVYRKFKAVNEFYEEIEKLKNK